MTLDDLLEWTKTLPRKRIAIGAGMVAIVIATILVLQMVRAARSFSQTIYVVDRIVAYGDDHLAWPKDWGDLNCEDLSSSVQVDFTVTVDDIIKTPEQIEGAVQPTFGTMDNLPEEAEKLIELGYRMSYKLKLKAIQDRIRISEKGCTQTDALEIGKLICDFEQWGWEKPDAIENDRTWLVTNTSDSADGKAEIILDSKTGEIRSKKLL